MNIGIVKSNLFQGWPKDSLAQIMYANLQPGFDVCEQYWALRKTEIIAGAFGFPADASLRGSAEACVGSIYDPAAPHSFESRPLVERLLSGIGKSVRVPIGEAILRLPSVISSPLARWIDQFAPDVVFTNGGNGAILRLAVKIARRWKVPMLPYFNDDWFASIYEGDFMGKALRASFVKWSQCSLDLSTVRLTASDLMGEEYSQRFGGRFEPFMNPIEVFDTVPEPQHPVVKFTYIGALAPDRWRPLFAIGTALDQLRSRGINGELVIYTFPRDISEFGERLRSCASVTVAGTIPLDQVHHVQQDANVLVHAESFEESARRHTRLSLSTKIPIYFMSERCVLAHGPGEIASVRYIADSGAGPAVTEDDVPKLAAELERLILHPEVRRAYAAQGRRTALTRHVAATQRERLRECFVSAVENARAGSPVHG